MEDCILEEAFLRFLKEYFGKSNISLDLDLEYDLYLTGDDVEVFFDDFSARFNVDISGVNYYNYFYSEDFEIIVWMKRLFRMKRKNGILINDLCKAIKLKNLALVMNQKGGNG